MAVPVLAEKCRRTMRRDPIAIAPAFDVDEQAGARWQAPRCDDSIAVPGEAVAGQAIDKLFARSDAALTDCGYLAMGGQIIDATVVPAPKRRNTDDEKAVIKEGKIPERWMAKPFKV